MEVRGKVERQVFCMGKKGIGFLVGIMALALAACGKGGEDISASKDYVYKAEAVQLEEVEDMSTLSRFYIRDGRMYAVCYNWQEEGGAVMTLLSRNPDGSDFEKIELRTGDNRSYSQEVPDGKGGYYAVLNEYGYDESDPDNVIFEDNYYLVRLDESGQELWKSPLNEDIPEGEGYWLQWMRLLGDGRIALMEGRGLRLYGEDGNLIKTVEPKTDIESSEAYQLANGDLVLYFYNSASNEFVLSRLDVETGEISDSYTIPGNSGSYSLYTGNGYDFYLVGNTGIYGYNLGDEATTLLMNFIDSDMVYPYVNSLAVVNEKEIYALSSDEMTGENVLLRMTKVDPEDVEDKTLLTLACYGLDWDVRGQIVEFNKSSGDYRIQITDYSQFDTMDDYMAGITRLNTDIASGKVPDILLLNNQLPVSSYLAKGLFEDLYPYIEKDGELNREDYLQNILEAYETDGRLYRLTPSFIIQTVAGKTKDVGAEPGWTLKELRAVMASKPEGVQYFDGMDRNGILRSSIQMTGEEFIDWDSGKCSFDSEGFLSLLEFANEFPETIGEDYYTEEYWNTYPVMWREGKVLLMMMYLDSFSSYNSIKKGSFGEDITLIGFPAEDGNGAAVSATLELAMSSKSKNKEGVWQFLRYFLTDEYQSKIGYGLPLSIESIEALGQEAMKRPVYEDETGALVEYDETFYAGDVEVVITPMTQEEVDEVLDYIRSVNRVYTYDEELIGIIQEEAAAYFAGQKKVKDVADIIQSRVQIYVNENR